MAEESFDAGYGAIESESSAFNMAIQYLSRINTLLYFCDEYAKEEDAENWFKTLKVLFRELSPKILKKKGKKEKKSEFDKQVERMARVEKKYDEYVKSRYNYVMTMKKNPAYRNIPFTPPNNLLKELHDWELSLREIMQKRNMLMPSKDDSRFTFK